MCLTSFSSTSAPTRSPLADGAMGTPPSRLVGPCPPCRSTNRAGETVRKAIRRARFAAAPGRRTDTWRTWLGQGRSQPAATPDRRGPGKVARRSRRRSLAVKQVANARERVLDIRRVSLEVRLNTAQEVGERSRIKLLYPVRIFTRFSFCLLNRRLELVLARLRGSCRLLKLPLENSQAPPEIVDDRTTRLREIHRLFSSRVRLRSVDEVEIDEEGSNGGGRGGCRDRSRSGGSNQRHRTGCGRLASRLRAPSGSLDPLVRSFGCQSGA